MTSRRLALVAVGAAVVVVAVGAATRMSAASFTASLDTGANAVSADQLSNHFSVTPGPAADGDVDGLAIDLGLVDAPKTVTGVFTVRNVSASTKTAALSFVGPQVATATFAASGTASATLAAGASSLRLADYVGGNGRRGRRHAAPEALRLDLALPRLHGRVRGGTGRAGLTDGDPEAGRRHRALLARLSDHRQPCRLRRLPLHGHHVDEAEHHAGHGHDLAGHVHDERDAVLLSRARGLQRRAAERRDRHRDRPRRLRRTDAAERGRTRQRRRNGQRLSQLGEQQLRCRSASRSAPPRSPPTWSP